jgi:hypothetical protein
MRQVGPFHRAGEEVGGKDGVIRVNAACTDGGSHRVGQVPILREKGDTGGGFLRDFPSQVCVPRQGCSWDCWRGNVAACVPVSLAPSTPIFGACCVLHGSSDLPNTAIKDPSSSSCPCMYEVPRGGVLPHRVACIDGGPCSQQLPYHLLASNVSCKVQGSHALLQQQAGVALHTARVVVQDYTCETGNAFLQQLQQQQQQQQQRRRV